MSRVDINIDYIKVANYALHHNRIPVCKSLEINVLGEDSLKDVRVSCEGEYIKAYSQTLAEVANGKPMRLSGFEVAPLAEKLAELSERIITTFKIVVTSAGEQVYEKSYDIELMPYDHWTGIGNQPQTLASFVTPNHPAISEVIRVASEILKSATGSTSFLGYQAGNPTDVYHQVAAIYKALHHCKLIYRGLPASYEQVGQRITLPHQVLQEKLANCIELSLLLASALEAVEINSGIVWLNGHARLAVWLVDDCYPCSLCDDYSFIESKCANGISEMLELECTMVTENPSLNDAIDYVRSNPMSEKFITFIDIKRCRLERYLPIPTRVNSNGTWIIDQEAAEADVEHYTPKECNRFDLSKLGESNKELTKFDIWERKLLDFTLRNTLLNMYLRKKAVQLISFDIDRLEDRLQDGEEYAIYHKPDVTFPLGEYGHMASSQQYEQLHELIKTDIGYHRLHTYLTEAESKDVLKSIYRAGRNAIEETGANSLFLAIGTVKWYETAQSDTPRYAPLLLLPVEMVYKKGLYHIRARDEEIVLNITLIEFLRQNYEVEIKCLEQLPKDKYGVDVKLIFAAMRDALINQKRWSVEEECVLGIFSFSKFLMWNDIHNHRKELQANPIIDSLTKNHLTWMPQEMGSDLKDTDINVTPDQYALPVAVDSSQMAAVIEGGKGNSFILYGPPGTGKSQTITNLIANALYQGKRVLFVAEKMAALSVVQNRLAKIGLDPFCLELHSNKVTKRHVIEQLDQALKVTHIKSPSEYADTASRIFAERKVLLEYLHALHEVDEKDKLSLYDCIVRYEAIEAQPLNDFVSNPTLDNTLATQGVKQLEEMLDSKLETILKLVGQPSQHALNGLKVDTAMVTSPDSAISQMSSAAQLLAQCDQQRSTLADTKALRNRLLRDNRPELLQADARELYDSWRAVKAKWFIPRFFAKRSFVAQMRQYNPLVTAADIDQLTSTLLDYSEKHSQIEKMRDLERKYFGRELPEDEVASASIIEHSINTLNRWIQNSGQMRDWMHWCSYCDELATAGMGCVARALESQSYTPQGIRDAFFKALFMRKAQQKSSRSALLASFEGMLFDERVKTYKKLVEEFQVLTQKELYARLAARIPRVTDETNNYSEIGLLNRFIIGSGRGTSLRELFDSIPTLMPRLCPCMLMSPMSVAQFINLDSNKFDLVIFDEASQMPTSEAVGSIARGKALIVVGDPKQMPPTSFFASTNVDEDEAAYDDMESILEDCRTLDMPSLQLNWHYRSRHESLIAFSNNEYYDGSLITFPSTDDQKSKVRYVAIDGYYDKGGKRSNKAEAEAIVNEIERRLRDENLRKHSIGVIAFSVVQQALIEDILQDRLENDKELHGFADEMYEPIFVKNLENVQGDERDVILFSVGYGPNKEGKVSMNFGPLNNQGGERRLNVAVSRARQEMIVFSTLKSSHIDLRRSKARGVEGLKHFLEYAETQSLASIKDETVPSDTTIAELIANELRNKGYVVRTEVGRSHFKVDVAVSLPTSPDVYVLGILLDGERYRDTITTRDREIVQQSVLSSLNWRVMRVWSVDWFNNSDRVINRIIETLKSDPTEISEEAKPLRFDISSEQIEEVKSCALPYKTYNTSQAAAIAMSDRALVASIVSTEQPIIYPLVCKRVASLRGVTRVTEKFKRELAQCMSIFHIENDANGPVVWMTDEASKAFKGYRASSGRDITEIPLVEIKNVVIEAVREQLSLDTANLTLVAAKKLGYTRRGTNVETSLNRAVDQLKAEGHIEEVNGKLRMKE